MTIETLNVSALHTDSLYKFMALSGVVLFVFAAYMTVTLSSDYTRRYVDHEIALETLSIDGMELVLDYKRRNDEVEAKQQRVMERHTNLIADMDNASDPGADTVASWRSEVGSIQSNIDDLNRFMQDTLRDFRSRAFDLNRQSVRTREEVQSFQQEGKRIIIYSWVLMVLAIGGFVLACIGFRLWYYRLQVHIDRKVREQNLAD